MSAIEKTILNIEGMTCANCEIAVENELNKYAGIKETKCSYKTGTLHITYDNGIINISQIKNIIEKIGYSVSENNKKTNYRNPIDTLILIFLIYVLAKHLNLFNSFNFFPEADSSTELGMLFIIGVLTSFHCIAMCGGINLSQCSKNKFNSNMLSSLLYNLGRVISYTLLGGIVGAFGSVISFSNDTKGLIQFISGIFIVIMGLNLLNIFPSLRNLNVQIPKFISKKAVSTAKGKGPLIVGLINGLMPCGPLQAMQIYALSTGSFSKGALAMLLFSLGTVPMMLFLSTAVNFIGKKLSGKIMSVSAVFVVILGISMVENGAGLSGISIFPSSNQTSKTSTVSEMENGIQVVKTSLSSGRYSPISVKPNVPVKWVITAGDGTLNGCNNKIIIPKYQVEKKLAVGENIIEFTPNDEGVFTYSCWMGMIRSSITVSNN